MNSFYDRVTYVDGGYFRPTYQLVRVLHVVDDALKNQTHRHYCRWKHMGHVVGVPAKFLVEKDKGTLFL